MEWNEERLAQLNQKDLRTLLENLRTQQKSRRISGPEADRAAALIEARITPAPVAKKRRLAGHVELDRRVAASLGALAERLARRFDLSTATARKRSFGTEGFTPHALTDRNGNAKVGASVKAGQMTVDRYISYRLGNSVISLSFLLERGHAELAGQYLLAGTDDIFPEGRALEEVSAAAADFGTIAGERMRMRALPMADLAEAERRFTEKLGTLAPAHVVDKRRG